MTEYLRETRTSWDGTPWVDVWHIEPPAEGVACQAVHVVWQSTEPLERHIYEIEVVPC